MLFNSFIFLIYLVIIWNVYRRLHHRAQIYLLIACSYFFYGYWDWRFCSLLMISTIVDFFSGKIIFRSDSKKVRKRFLTLSILVNLGLLGTFKYFNFFASSFNDLLASFNIHADFVTLNVVLPVGISFYTFQTMCYTIDIYLRKTEPTNDFPCFMLYVSYFPQLVAGPIERAGNLLPQLSKPRKITSEHISSGICLIFIGMFQKIVISDTVARFADDAFADPTMCNSIELVRASIFFTIQVYCDFSGYSHIARGTSRLFGVELRENFQQPFLATSYSEVWSRWHISLTSWLRDYLFIPLGGTRCSNIKIYRNVMITMVLCGLWHGAGWMFVAWGGFAGICLCIERACYGEKGAPKQRYIRSVKEFFIFFGFLILIQASFIFMGVMFRSQTFTNTAYIVANIVDWSGPVFCRTTFQIVFVMGILALFDLPMYFWRDHTFLLRFPRPVRLAIYTVMGFMVVMTMLDIREQPFFYFQF